MKRAVWWCMTLRLLFQTNPAMLQNTSSEARVALTLSPPLKYSVMTGLHSWIISQQVKKTRIPKGNSALSCSQTVETGRRKRKGIYLFGAVTEKCSQPEDWARGEKDTVRERRFSSVATTAVRLNYCQSAAVSVWVVLYALNVACIQRHKYAKRKAQNCLEFAGFIFFKLFKMYFNWKEQRGNYSKKLFCYLNSHLFSDVYFSCNHVIN